MIVPEVFEWQTIVSLLEANHGVSICPRKKLVIDYIELDKKISRGFYDHIIRTLIRQKNNQGNYLLQTIPINENNDTYESCVAIWPFLQWSGN